MSNIVFTPAGGDYVFEIPEAGFTINDENSEFSDGIFVSWTYPFTLYFTDEEIRRFGRISDPSCKSKKRVIDGYLNVFGEVQPAKLNFLSAIGRETKCQLEYGVGALNVFDKKLSEIKFPDLPKGSYVTYDENGTPIYNQGDIYDHVDEVLAKTFPEIGYCFPRIYAPKKDFTDIFGKRYGGIGIYNWTNTSTGKIYRNDLASMSFYSFVKPLLFIPYILQQGFLEEKFKLKGDILEDPLLMHTALDHNTIAEEEIDYNFKSMQIINNGEITQNYVIQEDFEIAGLYLVSIVLPNNDATVFVQVLDESGAVLYSYFKSGVYQEDDQNGNINVPDTIYIFGDLPLLNQKTKVTYKITIDDLGYFGQTGNLFKAYLNPKYTLDSAKIYALRRDQNLAQYTPDVTFGELIKMVKVVGNYRMEIRNGNEIHFLKNHNRVPEDYSDISFSESELPEVVPTTIDYYVLKHNAPDEYNMTAMIVDETGIVVSGPKADEEYEDLIRNKEVTTLEITGYPLPMISSISDYVMPAGGNTVVELEETVSGMALVKYDGLDKQEGMADINNAGSYNEARLPGLYYVRYDNYVPNRLTADTVKWTFITQDPQVSRISSESTLYAYGVLHKIKNIVKTYYDGRICEVQLETQNRY